MTRGRWSATGAVSHLRPGMKFADFGVSAPRRLWSRLHIHTKQKCVTHTYRRGGNVSNVSNHSLGATRAGERAGGAVQAWRQPFT